MRDQTACQHRRSHKALYTFIPISHIPIPRRLNLPDVTSAPHGLWPVIFLQLQLRESKKFERLTLYHEPIARGTILRFDSLPQLYIHSSCASSSSSDRNCFMMSTALSLAMAAASARACVAG